MAPGPRSPGADLDQEAYRQVASLASSACPLPLNPASTNQSYHSIGQAIFPVHVTEPQRSVIQAQPGKRILYDVPFPSLSRRSFSSSGSIY